MESKVSPIFVFFTGLSKQVDGYYYRLTTDSEDCFSGTAWQKVFIISRFLVSGFIIFVDYIRSGINISACCFWNIMILNQDRKSHLVMGAMTMDPSYAAVYWVIIYLVYMFPPEIYIITKTMSKLVLRMTTINDALPNVNISAACTWHIMVINFLKNLKHVPHIIHAKSMYTIILLGTLLPRLIGKPICITHV